MSERKFKEMYLTGIFETYLGDQVRDNAGRAWDDWLNSVKAEAWDEGYTSGFYDREKLSGDSRDASEGSTENPYQTGGAE